MLLDLHNCNDKRFHIVGMQIFIYILGNILYIQSCLPATILLLLPFLNSLVSSVTFAVDSNQSPRGSFHYAEYEGVDGH